MVKRIVWSKFALENKLEILIYWANRNKSNIYSRKLNKLFLVSAKLIRDYQSLGKRTDDQKIKYIIVIQCRLVKDFHIGL